VETPAQHEHLVRLQCDCVQGFLFGAATAAADFARVVEQARQRLCCGAHP
jgi:EAL domain-containing protein (putative c-di-GMP-specific phosphodiesterase class I)